MNHEDFLKLSLILEHRFQVKVSEKAIEDILESANGNTRLVIEKILWETAWQCNDYFPKADCFGMATPASKEGRVQLVNAPDMYFDYICRKIVLNNVLLDIFTALGREVHFGRKIHEPKYLTLYDDFGYYQIEKWVDESGNIKYRRETERKWGRFEEEMEEKSLQGRKRGKEKSEETEEEIDDISCWYRRKSNHYTDDVAKSLRESELVKRWKEIPYVADYLSSFWQKQAGEKVYLPLYDCQILSLVYNNRSILSYVNDMLTASKDDSIIQKFIGDLDKVITYAANICPLDTYGDGQRLDAITLKYQTEKYFHYELLQIISQVKKELQEKYSLMNPKINQSLLNFVYGNIHMGAEYILKYPLEYVLSSSIEQRLANWSVVETGKIDAAAKWVQQYVDYLDTFSFVTAPVVKMALEVHLHVLAEKMKGKMDGNLGIEVLGILEKYLKESDDFWNIDYYNMWHKEKFYDGGYLLSEMRISKIKGYQEVHSEYMDMAMRGGWNSYFGKHEWFEFQKCGLEKDIQFVRDAVLEWYEPNNYGKIYHPVLDSSYFGEVFDADSKYSYREKLIKFNKDWILKTHSK